MTRPTKTPEGTMFFDTSTDTLYISKGGYWHVVGDTQQPEVQMPKVSWWKRLIARIRSFFL